MAKAHKILYVGYFLSSIFKDCIEAVKKCPPYQIFQKKEHTHLALLHLIIIDDPFAKWGIDFMQCNPTTVEGHDYILIVVEYFTKWA
jgi:hypothetical protein